MSGTPWMLLAVVGWIRLGRVLLFLLLACIVVYGSVVFLQDVVGVLRPDGARCETDSNCLSLCHHPPLRPQAGYCSSDCSRNGYCSYGMQCKQVAEGWRCVANWRKRFGAKCGEDTECESERCVGLYARDGHWIEQGKARSEEFQGGFCVQPCKDRWDCPRASDGCVTLFPDSPNLPMCLPVL